MEDDDFIVPDDLASQVLFVSTMVVSAAALAVAFSVMGFVAGRLRQRERG